MQLERPNITSKDPKEQVQEIKSYLFKLVEQLELALESIDENNLSPSLLKKLHTQDKEIENIKSDMQYRQESTIVYVNKKLGTGSASSVDHVITDTDPGVGASVDYPDGTIILVKE